MMMMAVILRVITAYHTIDLMGCHRIYDAAASFVLH